MIMAIIDKLWLAMLTKNEDNAESAESDEGRLNLTINLEGEDVMDVDIRFGGRWPLDKGQAALSPTIPSYQLLNPIGHQDR
jgi:hypothetical protein